MKRGLEASEWNPLGQRFEVIDRFDGLDFDYGGYLSAFILRDEHHVRVYRRDAGTYGGVLFRPGVDPDIETTAKPGL
jgi:hypothetical protein